MAIINLLPGTPKKKRADSSLPDAVASFSVPPVLPIVAGLTALAVVVAWSALFFTLTASKKKLATLTQTTQTMQSASDEVSSLTQKESRLRAVRDFYAKGTGDGIRWSATLEALSDTIPDTLWLISIYTTEAKPTALLVIRGAATSSIESQIIDSISHFVEQLKQTPAFASAFEEIKLGPLIASKRGSLNVMEFSLFCSFRKEL